MTDLRDWNVPAILIWICTRDYEVIQTLFSGDAERDQQHVALHLARLCYKELPLKQANDELLAKLRCGELEAQGFKCDPDNKGNPVSDTVQDIPTCDWACLRIHPFPPGVEGRYAAFYRDNSFPSWRRVVCLSAAVRELWPPEPGSAMKLYREQVARTFLEGRFKIRTTHKGAYSAAIRHVARICNCSEDAAKQSTGKFISAEIERLRKAAKGC